MIPSRSGRDTLAVAREALAAIDAERVAGIGITNQRETIVLWDRATGEPIHRAIVWQDRRTAEECARLKADGAEELVREKTGLLLDPYFSATKIALDPRPCAGRPRTRRAGRARVRDDRLLPAVAADGRRRSTPPTSPTPARTSLFDIREGRWDEELCRLFRVPQSLLPEVHDNSRIFGTTAPGLLERELPIGGMAGDQQAALVGQACFAPGMAKSTYGTGCFMLVNTGPRSVRSHHRLLTTPAYRLGGETTYALEGIDLRRRRGGQMAARRARADRRRRRDGQPGDPGARRATASIMVPAFVGLGAPYWEPGRARRDLRPDARRLRGASRAGRAGSGRLPDARPRRSDGARRRGASRRRSGSTAEWRPTHGSASSSPTFWRLPVERPQNLETTALGAAFLAGLSTGVWPDLGSLEATWKRRDRFEPRMAAGQRERLIAGWRDSVARTLPVGRRLQ